MNDVADGCTDLAPPRVVGAKIMALDHVNIRTPDIGSLCRFLDQVLGMDVRPLPGHQNMDQGAWIFDAEGHACIHVASSALALPWDDPAALTRDIPLGSGRIHHIALRCSGYEATKLRLIERGQPFQCNDFPPMGLRQLFVEDPNSITFELNFFED